MPRIDPAEIPREWLIEPLPSFDFDDAARYELRRMQFEPERIEKILAEVTVDVRSRWRDFIAAAIPGDALWYFYSSPETWGTLSGRAGFAIIREGVPVSGYVTFLS
jgi:hypothetical protein